MEILHLFNPRSKKLNHVKSIKSWACMLQIPFFSSSFVRVNQRALTSSKNSCVALRTCISSVSSRELRRRVSALLFTSRSSLSNFSNVACGTRKMDVVVVVKGRDAMVIQTAIDLLVLSRLFYYAMLRRNCSLGKLESYRFFQTMPLTSRSTISRGWGASGFSPVSRMGSLSFSTSRSRYLSTRSISSQRRTSWTNLRWKELTSGFSCEEEEKKRKH